MCKYVSKGQRDQFNSEGKDASGCITIFCVPLSPLMVDGCAGLRAGQQAYPHLLFMRYSCLGAICRIGAAGQRSCLTSRCQGSGWRTGDL